MKISSNRVGSGFLPLALRPNYFLGTLDTLRCLAFDLRTQIRKYEASINLRTNNSLEV